MKKNSFDLTGKVIDCIGINEITFNTLKDYCNGEDDHVDSNFEDLKRWNNLVLKSDNRFILTNCKTVRDQIIKPIEVLGEPLMNAIEQGFTPVFEGDSIPEDVVFYWSNGYVQHPDKPIASPMKSSLSKSVIAYKPVESEESINGFSELKHVDNTPDWKERELETYSDDDKIESLAREVFVSQISRYDIDHVNINFAANHSWQAAREFYKVKG